MGDIDAEIMRTVGSHGISMGYKINGHDVSLVHQLWDVNGTTKQHWLDYWNIMGIYHVIDGCVTSTQQNEVIWYRIVIWIMVIE